jgi:hypothetical protein
MLIGGFCVDHLRNARGIAIRGRQSGSNPKGVLPKAGLNFRFGNRFVGRISVMKVAR